MNYIYKQVEKDFKKYQVVGNHSFDVFCRNYLEQDPIKSEETLNNALEIMGDYFHGRPIISDIAIVTEISHTWVHTPNGECSSEGNDIESDVYNKQHYKLHKKNSTNTSRCAEFNACLWCRHFRTIADAEHVWKLLSYRDFVIADMKASVSDYDGYEGQQEYINILNARVDEILSAIEDISSSSILEGQNLLIDNGIHPLWKFASTVSY
ncbi:hypothetical protein GNP88_16595 [Aliivibrio fischeri]|uniref:Uncharacterized protein n=2 Tax=Aliivibrio fischeri TaxID=668 RepID=A0A844P603_ALIFS|nr:hypothetical protein [Aliivibrio fischeri]